MSATRAGIPRALVVVLFLVALAAADRTFGQAVIGPGPKPKPAPLKSKPSLPKPKPIPPSPSAQGGTRSFDLGGGVTVEMVLIQASTFTMGIENGIADEAPAHQVTISRPYYLGTCEVTQRQWAAVMGSNPSYFQGENSRIFNADTLPVEQVSWEDCQEFVRRLNAATGGKWRLPTEAEWEYACRAGSTDDFAGVLKEMAWYRENAGDTPHPVGHLRPNAWGLYDMHGNIWEWCEDRYGPYASGHQVDPHGPSTGPSRVARGGCFVASPISCRSMARYKFAAGDRNLFIGLRLARASE